MADRLDENYTQFSSGPESRVGTFWTPTGRFGKFVAKFFTKQGQEELEKQTKDLGGKNVPQLAGDAFASEDQIKLPSGGVARYELYLPEVERSRKNRYKEYESMDEYPEIATAFDIYADDSTQEDIRKRRWVVKSDDKTIVDEVDELFEQIRLDRCLWDIVRNVVKYGDNFIETIYNLKHPERGIRRIKILNPRYILRVEDKYGYLQCFLQEIPDKQNDYSGDFGVEDKLAYIKLDKNQIIHFRLHTSDPGFYPYGKSVAAAAVRAYRSLKLMEDAMLIYRLSRAPERRIFYIDTGNLPGHRAEMFIENIKQKFKKDKFWNTARETPDARYNPMSFDEDFFVPVRNGSQGTKIETLPGAQNLGEVDDVKYFRDKVLASLKIPKDYVVEKDKSPERKANLSQLDVKFARTVKRVQQCVEDGLTVLVKKHLEIKNYPKSTYKHLRIELADPSDMFTKRKLEIDEAKARVVQAVVGTNLFPKEYIYKEYYDMTDLEIEEVQKKLEQDMEKEAEQQEKMGMAQPGMEGGMGGPGGPGMPPDAVNQAANEMQPKNEEVVITPINRLLENYKDSDSKMRLNNIKKRLDNNV